MSESPADLLLDREFEYRVNAMEAAAVSSHPADDGYAQKRLAVSEYVAELQRRSPNAEEIIRAAARVLLVPILDMIQEDQHSWSERGCQTCRAIGAIAGRPFGCYVYAARRAAERARAK